MFSIPYLLTQLYSRRGQVELYPLVERCFSDTTDYDSKTWKTVSRADLESIEIQLNIARTLWQLQFAYHGIGEEILRSLEEWADNRTMVFIDFDEETQEFYERYIAFLGFVAIGNLSANLIVKLLGSRFLVLAAAWDVSIYDKDGLIRKIV